jgi:mannose-6-phosphate isomerase-like protein (cupin superfamily)
VGDLFHRGGGFRSREVAGDGGDPRSRRVQPASHANRSGSRPCEGEHLGGPSSVTIKATGEDTDGSFYLGEVELEPGFAGPPPHIHERLHDMFYVLDGTLSMRVGESTVELQPGAFASVPPGVVHTFANHGERPVRFLNFNTPAGWENYMRQLAPLLAADAADPKEIACIASRYDFRIA